MKNSYLKLAKRWVVTTSMLSLFLAVDANAQLSGSKSIPGDYPTIAAAITDLNTQGVTAPGVTFNVQPGHTETAPAGGFVINTTTGSAASPIVFQGSGNVITAAAPQTTGVLTDAIIKILGTDYLTISGFTLQEDAANTVTTAGSNNMTEWAIAILYASPTDGAKNVTIQNNVISLNRTYQNTFGIYSNVRHSSTSISTAADITSPAGAMDNLKIYSNNISNVNIGIVVIGSNTPANYATGLDIGGLAPSSGNTLSNYGTTGTFSGYLTVSGTVNGIQVSNNINYNISYNSITSSNGGSTSGTLRGILASAPGTSPTVAATNTISNNTIQLTQGSLTSSIIGIEQSMGGSLVTLNILNNIFQNSGYAALSSGAYTGILNSGATQNQNINGNTFVSLNLNTTGSTTFISNNVSLPATGVQNVNNNAILNSFNKAGAGGTITFFTSNASSASGSVVNNNNNNFSNITVTGATTIAGWSNTDGGSPVKTINLNTFANISGGTGNITLMNLNFGTGNANQNFISFVTGGGAITGINLGSSGTGISLANNRIEALYSTGAATVTGITTSNPSTVIQKNLIADLEANNATGFVTGIAVTGGSPTIQNNVIGNLRTPSTSSTSDAIRGINITSTATSTNVNVYYNTIYLNAASTGANFSTAGVYHTSSATATTANLVLRNNIIKNISVAAGTGTTAALRRSGTSLANYSTTSNNNVFYAGTPSATNLIYSDGTNLDQTLGAFKARVAPAESASNTENVTFVNSSVNTAPDYLKVNPTMPSVTESGAVNISGVTDDYASIIRQGNAGYAGTGTAPDIGAYEFEGTPINLNVGATALAAPSATGCYTATETVTITIKNYATATLDFSVNPVTVSAAVTGPNPVTFTPVTISTGTLAAGASQNVVVSSSYDMTATGTYVFTATATTSGDGNTSNDAMPAATIVVSPGTASASATQLCAGGTSTLTLSGTVGTIQWQSSIDGTTWNNETGAGNTSATYTVAPVDTMMYRALVCGNLISNVVTVNVNTPNAPTASNVTRCGPGAVTLTASGVGTIKWYTSPTATIPVATGSTFNTTVGSSTTFYVASSAGGVTASVGLVNNSAGGGQQTSTAYNTFDVFAPITLTGVYTYPGAAGNVVFDLRDNTGALISSATVPVTAANVGVKTFIPLNFNLLPGTGYRLAQGTGSVSMFRNNAGVTFPYTLPGYISITGSSAGATFYYFAYDWQVSSACESSRTTVNVTVNTAPAITLAGGNNAICSGSSEVLTVSSTNTDYTYTWSPATGLSATTGTSVTASPTASTTYTVTATDANTGCSEAATTVITVNPLPVVTASATPGTICAGGSTQLNAALPPSQPVGTGTLTNTNTGYPAPYGNWYWGARHQFLITAAELTAAGYSAGNLSSLAFDVTNLNTSGPLTNFEIKIGSTALTALPTTFQSGLTTVYNAASYMPVMGLNTHTFTAPFYWNGTSNIIVETCFNNAAYTYNASVKQSTTSFASSLYFRDDVAGVCTTATGTTVNQRPNITFGTMPTVTYSWTPATGLSSTSVANPTAAPTATTTYTVSLTDANGCVGTSTVEVIVNPLPTVAGTTTNDTICSGYSTVLMATGALNYSWNPSATLNSPVGATVTATPTATTTYTVTGTDVNGCMNTSSVAITVNPSPTVGILSGQSAVCPGSTATLTLTGSTGTLQWYQSTDNNNFTPISGATGTTLVTAAITDTMWFGAIATLGTCTDTTQPALQVNLLPSVTGSLVSSTNATCFGLCNGSAEVSASGGSGPFSYNWNSVPSQNTAVATGLCAGNYSVVVMNSSGCSDTVSVTITEPTAITATINVTQPTCFGGTNGTLSPVISGGTPGYTMSWTPVGTDPSNVSAGTYVLMVTDANNCSATFTATVTDPAPVMPVIAGNDTICSGTSTALTATGGASYMWNTGDATASIIVSPTATTTYTVTATDNNGCTGTSTVEVVVEPAANAGFTYMTTTGMDFDFTATGGTTYTWDFGDATTGTGSVVSHTYTANGTYNVILTATTACGSDTSMQVIIVSGGIAQAATTTAISVYPNPSKAQFTLEVGNTSVERITVMDAEGRIVIDNSNVSDSMTKTVLDLSGNAKGVYTLRVIGSERTETLRLILN